MSFLKEKLKMGKRVYGSAVVSPSPLWPNMVKKCGLDFVFLDTEHMPLERATLSSMCQVYNALGLTPIVRTPSPDPYEASKAMDAGAVGIVAPYLETPEQIHALVGAVKYRPLKGERLDTILAGESVAEPELAQYIEERNSDNIVIANIESTPALERLDDMLDVPGVDGVFIGPHDLSCSLGLPEDYQHPRFKSAVKEIIKKCRERDIAVGIHFPDWPEYQVEWANAGATIIIYSADIFLYAKQLEQDMGFIKKQLGDDHIDSSESILPVI